MVRAVTSIAAQNAEAVAELDLSLPDLETGRDLTIAEWFHRIRAASNPAAPARALLHSLSEALRGQPTVVAQMFGDGTLRRDDRVVIGAEIVRRGVFVLAPVV